MQKLINLTKLLKYLQILGLYMLLFYTHMHSDAEKAYGLINYFYFPTLLFIYFIQDGVTMVLKLLLLVFYVKMNANVKHTYINFT